MRSEGTQRHYPVQDYHAVWEAEKVGDDGERQRRSLHDQCSRQYESSFSAPIPPSYKVQKRNSETILAFPSKPRSRTLAAETSVREIGLPIYAKIRVKRAKHGAEEAYKPNFEGTPFLTPRDFSNSAYGFI
jgi:hypothetical protein